MPLYHMYGLNNSLSPFFSTWAVWLTFIILILKQACRQSQSNFLPSGSFKCMTAHIFAHYLKICRIYDILSRHNEAIFYEMSIEKWVRKRQAAERCATDAGELPCVTVGGEKVICEETYLPRWWRVLLCWFSQKYLPVRSHKKAELTVTPWLAIRER